MCGIVERLRLDGGTPDLYALATMTDAIAHRGADDSGTFEAGSVAFGFRRLSILDMSRAGNKPMATPGGEAVIVFNGEIFNFIDLRSELEGKGHSFVSRSDTEVLLLDVIYRSVEEGLFRNYMQNLFLSSSKFVIAYSSNFNQSLDNTHGRHWKFTITEIRVPGLVSRSQDS